MPKVKKDEVREERIAEDDCMHDMLVAIVWAGRTLAIPLMQLEPIAADEKTREAIEDWHYYVASGYEF